MTLCPNCKKPSKLVMRLAHTSVWECSGSDCGLQFANPQLEKQELSRAYEDFYYPAEANGKGVRYEGTPEAVLKQLFAQLQGIVGPVQKLRMLDYGCGNGALLRVGRQFGLVATGVERDENARRVAASIPGVGVYEDLPGLRKAAPSAEFELIVLWNVIEHLRCPWSELRQLCSMLAPGGYVVLATMNIRCLRALLERERWENYENPTHFYYFGRKSLRHVLLSAGFRDPLEWKIKFQYPHHGILRGLAYRAACMLGASDGLVYLCQNASMGADQKATGLANHSDAAFVESLR